MLDAACASSMAALDYSVMALRTGKADVVISGGADEMMSPAAYVKFCKIGALSPDGSYPFDSRANGFVMGEAVGIYILKRLSDAVKDGDKIYALINAVGASSDGKGKGITAPNPKGQKLAIENTFKELEYNPGDVDFVECHGTATKVGDATECDVIKEIFKSYLNGKKIKVTSAKSNIGHTKAAAGAVSLIKSALSIYNKILPPSANFENPNPNIDFSVIDVIKNAEEWKKSDGPRRVNISSFGFGGTNFHVAIEEYLEGKTKYSVNSAFEKIESVNSNKESNQMKKIEIKEDPKAPFSLLQGETYTVTAKDIKTLSEKISKLKSEVEKLPEVYPQTLISIDLNSKSQEEMGVSIVSKSPKDLLEKIEVLNKNFNEKVFDEIPLNFKLKGIYPFKRKTNYKGKVGFVFPGQGSQYVDMMRDLAMKYDVVMDTFKEADKILEKMIGVTLTDTLWSKPGETKEELIKRENAIKQTQMTQPAVMTADMAMFRLLMSYGIKPEMVIGHSLGEYAAATCAGIFTLENGLRAVTSRAKEMSNIKVKDPGKMASVAWPYEKVEEQLKKINGYVVAANKNCPIQTVIAGEKEAVDEAVKLFKALGVEAQEIAVSHAFHSEIIRPAIEPYRNFLKKIPIKSWDIPIISNVTADFFPKDTEAIYDLLVTQMVSPVEFINQIRKMYDEGVRVFIECGPKRVLSAFVTETLKDKDDVFILSTNHPKRGGIYDFNDAIANLLTVNFNLNWEGKNITEDSKFYNPYYLNWALSFTEKENKEEVKREVDVNISEFAKNYGFNFNPIAISGIAAGAPGSMEELFREKSIDDILEGKNMIEPIPQEWRENQINKNIIRVVKSETGNHRIESINSVDESIKLSARAGRFDLVKEFGVPEKMAEAMNSNFRMALAAGVLALKDAHIPLVHYYKKTTTGGWLPEKWALPPEIADETGVIFASAFPTMESIINEVTGYFMDKYGSLGDDKLWDVYESIVDRIHSEEDKKEIRKWMKENLSKFSSSDKKSKYQFSQNFLLKVIPIADSQFAQFVGAKGPSIHLSAACSSTTQAVHVAESWIRSGKCKRVVVIAADDITNKTVQEWTMPGFLASGTATTKERVEEAALPFDKRRHGLIVGSGAVALVVEDETLVRERGVVPLARVLLTEAANSAYHVTRLDTEHVASIMDNFVTKIEKIYGLKREEIADKTLFVSHETYTPARGGSASAEVKALKKAFREAASKVVVSNVKGFTGHTMGASIEDAVAVRALNTGIVPPIANYKEPDPELSGINLSKGGKYNLKYAIRFAAGFGSHMGMSFIEKIYTAGEKRIFDEKKYNDWLKRISGYDSVELEVVNRALRIKDKGPSDFKKEIKEIPTISKKSAVENIQKSEVKVEKSENKVLTESEVSETIVNMIASKTGYPKDMLDLDLDMEADLGIDTVKQAELFGMIREHYGIPRQENLSLKDYPTIRHCVKFVMDNKGVGSVGSADIKKTKSDDIKSDSATLVKEQTAVLVEEKFKVDVASIMNQIKNKHSRHIRYVPVLKEMPVKEEIIKKIDPSKPALIIGEDIELIKIFRNEFSKLGVSTIVITPTDTKLRDSYVVNFKDISEVEKTIKEISSKNSINGIVYLMGCVDKKLDSDTNPFEDLKYYVMPLFLSAKYFADSLNNPSKDFSTFLTMVTRLDGGLGYQTKNNYDPIYAAIYGVGLCLRKEFDKSVVKIVDFPKEYDLPGLVKRTFYEIQYSDLRCAVAYNEKGKRYAILAVPHSINKEKENFSLKKKKLLITGAGRGLGSIFAKIASHRWKPEIIIMDIIELDDNAEKFAAMSEEEFSEYKTKILMEELKKKRDKVTPVMLEKEFTRIKDSANLFKTIKEIEALGSKVHYYRCDLNNQIKFKEVINEIRNKFGKLDGIVHFAGLERSKLVTDKTLDEFFLIFNTKANSAINFWKEDIIKENGLWVMISSIAGKFGNLGQSDYASASDYISKFAINLFNKGIKAFSIDMTAIANVGMGIRPGVEAFLKSQGVDFLYPEEVMNALADEISFGEFPEVIYSGSLGKLDWDKQLQYEESFPGSNTGNNSDLHFIESVKQNSDSQGFLAEKKLTVEKEKYLLDHAINETPVFPGVMGLEAFAETVISYTGKYPTRLSDVNFKLPIKLLKNKPVDINIRAVKENSTLEMLITSEFFNLKGVKMGDTRLHFTARYTPQESDFSNPKLPKIKEKYKIDKDTIYKTYFHGPSFQVLDGIIDSNRNEVVAVFKKPSARLLGEKDFDYCFHPMIIEAVFQTCGWRDLHNDNKMTLPDSIAEVKVRDNSKDPDKLFTYAVFKGLNEYGKSVYDAWAFDEKGEIYVELKNYVMIPVNII
ncbi:MAG: SDR family NAD(P)-dependent oxidoreductase [Elusimicrobiales bacterium]